MMIEMGTRGRIIVAFALLSAACGDSGGASDAATDAPRDATEATTEAGTDALSTSDARDAAVPPGGPVDFLVPDVNAMQVTQIYFGKYVAYAFDWGFAWLDVDALTAGYVQAMGYCNNLVQPPSSGWYVVGDCNGISTIASDGTSIYVLNFNGQCDVIQHGCGSVERGVFAAFAFQVGTWAFQPTSDPNYAPSVPPWPADSGQKTDPYGRTWKLTNLSTPSITNATYEWSL